MTVSTYQRARWIRDLLRFLPLKSQFVLSGNVRDLQIGEVQAGNATWQPLVSFLAAELRAYGAAEVLIYEPTTGFRVVGGQQTKMEQIYTYLTGPRFRHRIEAIVEKFGDMQADLAREKRATTRLWAKREAQIQGVIEATVGMYGDMQGIVGRAMQEIPAIEVPLIDATPAGQGDLGV